MNELRVFCAFLIAGLELGNSCLDAGAVGFKESSKGEGGGAYGPVRNADATACSAPKKGKTGREAELKTVCVTFSLSAMSSFLLLRDCLTTSHSPKPPGQSGLLPEFWFIISPLKRFPQIRWGSLSLDQQI